MKTVYMCFATDVIHEGHMNVVKKAKEYGKVVAGVLCDAEMVRYNRFPTVSFEERMAMVRNIPEIDEVIVQDRIMYDNVIKELKPDYVIHGDNWCDGPEKTIRENVIALLKEYGGELIEVPYTYNEKVKKIDDQFKEKLAMPEYRRKRLRQLIKTVPIVKTIEVHSGLTGLIAEKTVVEHDGGLDQFDAMWISSLCDSTAKGKPDIELVDMSSRLRTIDDVLDVTTKPIILDGDTGGLIEHFVYNVRTLERMGVSAVIIEDKTGLKKNSLFGTEVEQTQDSIENFCAKIRAGKDVLRTEEFMIIARIESLILERGMEDALTRAFAYVEAGADGSGGLKCRDWRGGRGLCADYRIGNRVAVRGSDPHGPSYLLVRGRGLRRSHSGKCDQCVSDSTAAGAGGSRRLWPVFRRLCGGLGHGADGDREYRADFYQADGSAQRAWADDRVHGGGTDGWVVSVLLFPILGGKYNERIPGNPAAAAGRGGEAAV